MEQKMKVPLARFIVSAVFVHCNHQRYLKCWHCLSDIHIPFSLLPKLTINVSGMDPGQVYKSIKKGYRHPKPDRCPDAVYKLMLSCWNADPLRRPCFAELYSTLLLFDSDDKRLAGWRTVIGCPYFQSRCVLCTESQKKINAFSGTQCIYLYGMFVRNLLLEFTAAANPGLHHLLAGRVTYLLRPPT